MLNESEDQIQYAWLALRCQSGEPGAFEDLNSVMEQPLLHYASTLTGNPDTALDVLQDVWLKVVRGIRKLKDPNALRPWLYSITHGAAVDRIRRDYKRDKAEPVHCDGVHPLPLVELRKRRSSRSRWTAQSAETASKVEKAESPDGIPHCASGTGAISLCGFAVFL